MGDFNIGHFDPNSETWNQYYERFEQHLLVKGITTDNLRKAHLLTAINPQTYNLLRSLVAPTKPADVAFGTLLQHLSSHYNPQPSEIVERFRFNSRTRKCGESISTFVSELRRLAEHCNYGTTLDTMLRDRIVCGIQDCSIQKRLLAEPALTLQNCMEISLAMETASRNAEDLQTGLAATSTQASTMPHVHQLKSVAKSNNHIHSNYKQKQNRQSKHTSSATVVPNTYTCLRCGRDNHTVNECSHVNSKCNSCGKIGHLSRVCISSGAIKPPTKRNHNKSSNKQGRVHTLQSNVLVKPDDDTSNTNSEYDIFNVHACTLGQPPPPIILPFKINGVQVNLELDSGAAFSLISKTTYLDLKHVLPELEPSDTRLVTYTGHQLVILGCCHSKVVFQDRSLSLPLLVVAEGKANLCGRNWIEAFGLLANQIPKPIPISKVSVQPDVNVHSSLALQTILDKHKKLFEPGLGLIKGTQVHLQQRTDIQPKFLRARSVPYALRDKVSQELDRLQTEGIIEPISSSEWAAPIVPVLKKDKTTVRICGDFKLTANAATVTEQYPLPRITDLFSNLAGGQKFTKLDMKDAYNQLELDTESRNLVVINTHKGLFRYTRLPFGVSSASAVFQRRVETLIEGVPSTSAFQDDLIITGCNDTQHLSNLEQVLDRLDKSGAKLSLKKCKFMLDSVEYVGHVLDSSGIHPTNEKLEAITNAPPPTNVEELRSFIGLLTYYAKFLPNMSSILTPLYNLTSATQPWQWTATEQQAFEASKKALISNTLLVHYDPSKEVVLCCDASPYGVGAVLSHVCEDGSEKPIAFASRTLSKAERNYSHIEKEALGIIFGVTKYRDYLLGRNFILLTDHRALTSLFSENKTIPSTAAARIQRWALTLSAYNYKIRFRPGAQNGNADALSRLPLSIGSTEPPEAAELVLSLESIENCPITRLDIVKQIETDPMLTKIATYIQNGWPKEIPEELKKFHNRQHELQMYKGLIIWNNRVLIPSCYRPTILKELHDGHSGITSIKRLARSKVWWPNIDRDIEELVKSCIDCQQHSSAPPQKKKSWPTATKSWTRVHLDYAGPIDNCMLLVIVDAFSNWIEALPVQNATSAATVEKFQTLIARFGLPQCVVTDNGTPFTGHEFQQFILRNSIQHITSAPYHPASNGLAERAVRTVKTGLMKISVGSIQERLSRILFSHRRTPQACNGKSPAELFIGRRLRSRLDLLHPNSGRQNSPDKYTKSVSSKFKFGQPVWIRNYRQGPKWLEGTISKTIGEVMLQILLPTGVTIRHIDQIRPRTVQVQANTRIDPQPIIKCHQDSSLDFPGFHHNVDIPVIRPIVNPELPPNNRPLPVRRSARTRQLPTV